ncbi:MAG TPA: hypothetical protein VJ596_09010 [Gemmatimonadaceae bacterium]|nr:hypothetical protein [Gemmatimonadaceae bacterium]
MKLANWLETRTPAAPPLLLDRLRGALGSDLTRDADASFEICLSAAERLLTTILTEGSGSRSQAVDLLAADALVTYAFEAASSEADRLAQRADAAMARLAALAGGASS